MEPVSEPVPLAGQVARTPWAGANVLKIDRYPWYAGGHKQPTLVRMLYDAASLYVQFRCSDRHILSRVTELNGMVCEDSCVELFASPHPDERADYFNLEVNCCGCMHLGWGPERNGRRLVTPEPASRVHIATSEPAPTRDESPDDRRWWVAAAIPFAMLGEFAGHDVRPTRGDVWRANFYRCGGRPGGQYAVWSPIDWPHPDYHRPEFFGTLRFG